MSTHMAFGCLVARWFSHLAQLSLTVVFVRGRRCQLYSLICVWSVPCVCQLCCTHYSQSESLVAPRSRTFSLLRLISLATGKAKGLYSC